MNVEFPQIDFIVHSMLDNMRKKQAECVKLMNQSNNFINITFESLIDRITRQYDSVSIIEILSLVKSTLDEEMMQCEYALTYDDIISNAAIVSQALKKAITSPSTRLVKIEKKVVSNKVTRFDSKTMAWLAKRPGKTIQEKIGAKNLIPTKVTYFTQDTMENRHTLYLYDCLYDNLYDKIYPNDGELPCETCDHPKESCFGRYEKMRDILLLKRYLLTEEWKEVKKEKQLKQNNKLMSDKEYKQIWDAVRNIDFYEQNCKSVWDNLLERYQFISFLIVCSKVFYLEDIKVYDMFTQFVDNGKLSLQNEDGTCNIVKFYSEKNRQTIVISLENNKLHTVIYKYSSKNNIDFKRTKIYDEMYNLGNFFDELENIDKKQNELEELEAAINEYSTKIKCIDDELYKLKYVKENSKAIIDNYNERKLMLSNLGNCMLQISEEMIHSVEKEQKEE